MSLMRLIMRLNNRLLGCRHSLQLKTIDAVLQSSHHQHLVRRCTSNTMNTAPATVRGVDKLREGSYNKNNQRLDRSQNKHFPSCREKVKSLVLSSEDK
ncbi:hypothetical protein O3M35_007771 [Rhynocoris fuscipes]|uniref:Uncharacterized protein n=1 Tax=Rhynocoris fuscipes TaxID=488301 RepID=A0AAW1DHU4_9HEMI